MCHEVSTYFHPFPATCIGMQSSSEKEKACVWLICIRLSVTVIFCCCSLFCGDDHAVVTYPGDINVGAYLPMSIHESPSIKSLVSHRILDVSNRIYPLVNVYITVGNHHLLWANQLVLWPFSIAFCLFTKGSVSSIQISSDFPDRPMKPESSEKLREAPRQSSHQRRETFVTTDLCTRGGSQLHWCELCCTINPVESPYIHFVSDPTGMQRQKTYTMLHGHN